MTQMKWYHLLVREIACWIVGHNWKCSWRKRDDFYEYKKNDSLTYREKKSGNPYFWFSAGWHYRCRRCRKSIRSDSWYPFYKHLWWSFTWSLKSIVWNWNYYRNDSNRTWKDFGVTILTTFWSFPHDLALYMFIDSKDTPGLFYEWIFDVNNWLMCQMSYREKKE